jgi:membrane protease YdiL (CAAX protease family)
MAGPPDDPAAPEPLPEAPPPELCLGCQRPLKPGAAFCSGCGRRKGSRSRPPETARDRALKAERAWRDLRGLFVLYGLLLATSAVVMAVARFSEPSFGLMVAAMAADTVFIVAAAARHRRTLGPSMRTPGFGPLGYAGVALAAPVLLVLVVAYVKVLTHAFGLQPMRDIDDYEGRGLAVALALGALWPALFEEAAFRGVILPVLQRHAAAWEALLVSSFAFAILHLSVPSLVTHLPMGLWFGWLRYRSGSLWPGVFAHGLHNGLILVGESAGLL